VITHLWECSGNSSRCTSCRRKPDTYNICMLTNKPCMATYHKGPTRPKSLCYTSDEVLVPIRIVRPDCRLGLPRSPSLLSVLEYRLRFVQVFTKLCRFTRSHYKRAKIMRFLINTDGATTLEPRISMYQSLTFPSHGTLLFSSCLVQSQIKLFFL
jgi:hypothetical protein